LVSGDQPGTVKLWNLPPGTEAGSLPLQEWAFVPMAWSPDGAVLMYMGELYGCPIWLWSRSSGEIRALPCCGPAVWSPDSTKVACTRETQAVVILEASTGEEVTRIADWEGCLHSLTWNSDGKALVTGWGHTPITSFDAESGQEIRTLWPGNWQAYFMALRPDETILATLSAEEFSLRLWGPATGGQLATPAMSVPSLCWSPNGEYLAAASLEGVVKVWKVSEVVKR